MSRIRSAWNQASSERVIFLGALFLLLLVIGVGLICPFGLSFFDDPGSAADWVAAVGTWVIGFGAIRLAAGDRDLKLRERQESRIGDLAKDLEDVQKVARDAKSALSEFRDARKSLAEELMKRVMLGFRNSVAIPHVRRTAYFLSWTPTQLRLLSPKAAALADDVSAKAQRLISRCDQVSGKGDAGDQLLAAAELRDAVREIEPMLSRLRDAAEADCLPIRESISRLQQRLDEGV